MSDRPLIWRCDSVEPDRVKQSWRQSLIEHEAEALNTATHAFEDSASASRSKLSVIDQIQGRFMEAFALNGSA